MGREAQIIPELTDPQSGSVLIFGWRRVWYRWRVAKWTACHCGVTLRNKPKTEVSSFRCLSSRFPILAGTAGKCAPSFEDKAWKLGAQLLQEIHSKKSDELANGRIICQYWNYEMGPRANHCDGCTPLSGTGAFSQGSPPSVETMSLCTKGCHRKWLTAKTMATPTPDGNEKVEVAFWSTGKVGMTELPTTRTSPLAAATTGLKGLEAIIPIRSHTSYINYYRFQWSLSITWGYLGEDIDVL